MARWWNAGTGLGGGEGMRCVEVWGGAGWRGVGRWGLVFVLVWSVGVVVCEDNTSCSELTLQPHCFN